MDLIFAVLSALLGNLFALPQVRAPMPPLVLEGQRSVVGDSVGGYFGTLDRAENGTYLSVYRLDGSFIRSVLVMEPQVVQGLRSGVPVLATRPHIGTAAEKPPLFPEMRLFPVEGGIALKGPKSITVSSWKGQWGLSFLGVGLESLAVDEKTGTVYVVEDGAISTTTVAGTSSTKLLWPAWLGQAKASEATTVLAGLLGDGRFVFEAHCTDETGTLSSKIPPDVPLAGKWSPEDMDTISLPGISLLCAADPATGKVRVIAAEHYRAYMRFGAGYFRNIAVSGADKIVWSMNSRASGVRVFTAPPP